MLVPRSCRRSLSFAGGPWGEFFTISLYPTVLPATTSTGGSLCLDALRLQSPLPRSYRKTAPGQSRVQFPAGWTTVLLFKFNQVLAFGVPCKATPYGGPQPDWSVYSGRSPPSMTPARDTRAPPVQSRALGPGRGLRFPSTSPCRFSLCQAL